MEPQLVGRTVWKATPAYQSNIVSAYQSNIVCQQANRWPLTGAVFDQVARDVVVSVEAGRPQRRAVCAGGGVDVDPPCHQQTHDLEVAGGGGAPQRRRTLDGLAVENHCRHRTPRSEHRQHAPDREVTA